MRSKRARVWLLSAAAAGAVLSAASSSYAWKPYTHVYLAQQAWIDAVDDGYVTIYKVNPKTGEIWRDAAGRPEVQGTFKVQERVLRAIRNSPQKFFAGVLGPDAYPDIVTGQMRIHPPGPEGSLPDADNEGPGTDAWLQQIWSKAFENGSDDAIAFAAGFLSHAAGDVYAHTFMNTFAGGIFDMKDMKHFNWFKHITVEGYVGERTPELDDIHRLPVRILPVRQSGDPHNIIYDLVRVHGVDGIEGFVADNTWDVKNIHGQSLFANESGKKISVPWYLEQIKQSADSAYSHVRAVDSNLWHQFSQAAWDASPPGMASEVSWACGGDHCPDGHYSKSSCPGMYPHGDHWYSGTCIGMTVGGGIAFWAAARGALAAAYGTAYSAEHPVAWIIENWANNASRMTPVAMRDWVRASHNSAIHLFFSFDHMLHTDGVEFDGNTLTSGYGPFKIDLESILTGLPRGEVQLIHDIIDAIMLPITEIKTIISDAEKWIFDQVFQAIFHMSVDQAKQCFVKPHMWFNPLLKNNNSGMSATLASANKIMRIPDTMPATCPGSTDQCTIAPHLVGADVAGACDIMTGKNVAKFTVNPNDKQPVFPAAFNAVNMMKLLLMDKSDVEKLANAVRSGGPVLRLDPAQHAQNAPANAMLDFVASIDGSHEWLTTRNFDGFGGKRMILAQNCNAYRSVFLDQRPDFTATLTKLAGLGLKSAEPHVYANAWEPLDACVDTGPIVQIPILAATLDYDTLRTAGYITVKASEASNYSTASTGINAFNLAITRGSISPAPDGMTAKYYPPKFAPLEHDSIIVTSKDGNRRSVLHVSLPAATVLGGVRRDLPSTPVPGKSGNPAGLQAGEQVQLVGIGKSPMTWSIVSGPGTLGDAKLEATHAATLAKHAATIDEHDQKLATIHNNLSDATCKGACRTQAVEAAKAAARARINATVEHAKTEAQLDQVRSTFHAPATITKDEVVTLRGVDKEGHTAEVQVRLFAPPNALHLKAQPPQLRSGHTFKLDVDGEIPIGNNVTSRVPMKWQVVSGPGAIGAHPDRAKHEAQKDAFLASLKPLNDRLVNAKPWEVEAAQKAWLDHVTASVKTYAPTFAALEEIENTYHAPAQVTTKQRVVLRGTAQDGSGRTVDVAFDVHP